jgi:hypothetical protein
MSTNTTDPYYRAGYEAFGKGEKLADAPREITRDWEIGWLDALADSVRPPRPAVKGPAQRMPSR